MVWFDETCINSDNIDMNDCRRIINCAAPPEGAFIDMIAGCNLNYLKMNNKTSPLILRGINVAPDISAQHQGSLWNSNKMKHTHWYVYFFFGDTQQDVKTNMKESKQSASEFAWGIYVKNRPFTQIQGFDSHLNVKVSVDCF